jgi:hypothetical protein
MREIKIGVATLLIFARLRRSAQWLAIALAATIVIGGTAAPAHARKVGKEFIVDCGSFGLQTRPSVTGLKDGGFVAACEAFGQRYDSNGKRIGKRFQIDKSASSANLHFLSLAGLNDGGFVAVWSTFGGHAYGQRYDSVGNRAGPRLLVTTYTTVDYNIQFVSVVGLYEGGFVVTWSDGDGDGNGIGIYGKRYDLAGKPAGHSFPVNTSKTQDQAEARVGRLMNGGFVVTWSSAEPNGSSGIYGQRYDSAGRHAGREFLINTYTLDSQIQPSVAGLNDGGFVVTWTSNGQDGDGYGIYAQRYSSDGKRILHEFRVNTYTTDSQTESSVAALSDGGFVITWTSRGQDGDIEGVYGRVYDSAGKHVGKEFRVNTSTTNSQHVSSVAGLTGGGFVATWSSQGGQESDGPGVYGQRFAP